MVFGKDDAINNPTSHYRFNISGLTLLLHKDKWPINPINSIIIKQVKMINLNDIHKNPLDDT